MSSRFLYCHSFPFFSHKVLTFLTFPDLTVACVVVSVKSPNRASWHTVVSFARVCAGVCSFVSRCIFIVFSLFFCCCCNFHYKNAIICLHLLLFDCWSCIVHECVPLRWDVLLDKLKRKRKMWYLWRKVVFFK